MHIFDKDNGTFKIYTCHNIYNFLLYNNHNKNEHDAINNFKLQDVSLFQ